MLSFTEVILVFVLIFVGVLFPLYHYARMDMETIIRSPPPPKPKK